jgi:alpha-galactosidase
VDTFDVTRFQVGINPFQFCWKLDPGASFTSPEAVLVYSRNGLNDMSQTFHRLYRTRLARGEWRDKERPILLNNWEATYFDFDQEKLLRIAQTAKEVGVELFVLDDGWFGKRTNDRTGLGDWVANRERFPDTIGALSEKIHDMGLKFGLWFEPEMVNKDSDLYRTHPDWILEVAGHSPRHGRNQFVLDFSREEVVDAIYEQMARVIEETKLDYIKWDMNRPLTDVFSKSLAPDQQGEVFHRYVLGLYHLYDRLTTAFPSVLFESCASGGGRFDPGLLYYAPQTWTSDDTDAVERLKIQYGTSLVYPLSTMGAHVSIVPNHQTNRITPLATRGNVAYFGVFGYELDLADLTQAEKEIVKEQIAFYKKERSLIHQGNFYRLRSPFDSNQVVWSVVSQNRSRVILAQYKLLNEVNRAYDRVYLQGLNADALYEVDGKQFSGAELMLAGFSLSDASCGQPLNQEKLSCDFDSHIWVFEEVT